jgi:hypothetical protein
MKLRIMQFSPVSCHFIFETKYSPQHPVISFVNESLLLYLNKTFPSKFSGINLMKSTIPEIT